MEDEHVFRIALSSVRLRLIELLTRKPRTISELGDALALTTQAVLKHINILEKEGLVEKATIEEGGPPGPRNIYRLKAVVESIHGQQAGLRWLHLFVKYNGEQKIPTPARPKRPRKVTDAMQEVEVESRLWRRKLRLAQERERRLFREYAALEEERRMLMKTVNFTPVDEVLLAAYLGGEGEEGLKEVCRHLNVEVAAVGRFLRKLSMVMAEGH